KGSRTLPGRRRSRAARWSRGRSAMTRPRGLRPPRGRAAPVVEVRRARALARYHARADRRLRRARGAERLALPRLERALQHLAALTRLVISHARARHGEAPQRVEPR